MWTLAVCGLFGEGAQAQSPSTDATLSGLALADADDNAISLTPAFAIATKNYTASVANGVDEMTVTLAVNQSNATVEYLDADDMGIDDADAVEDGQQVSLEVGANTIKVKVTAEDDSITETYTVVATRLPPTVVPADWSLIPDGLVAGDQFRLLFLSSTKLKPDSTDIVDYNTFAQGRAAAGHTDIQAYSPGFRVVGCTADDDARDNTATTYTTDDKGVAIYWLGVAKVAADYERLLRRRLGRSGQQQAQEDDIPPCVNELSRVGLPHWPSLPLLALLPPSLLHGLTWPAPTRRDGAALTALTVTLDGTALTLMPDVRQHGALLHGSTWTTAWPRLPLRARRTATALVVYQDRFGAELTDANTSADGHAGEPGPTGRQAHQRGGEPIPTPGMCWKRRYGVLVIREGPAVHDLLVLVELYNSTDGANWKGNPNWGSTEPFAEWDALTTTGGNNERIRHLALEHTPTWSGPYQPR